MASEHRWGHENATWVRITHGQQRPPTERDPGREPQVSSEAVVRDRARRLRHGNIKYPLVFVGPFRLDGGLPAYPFGERIRRSFRILREEHPDAVPLPWVGGIEGKQLRLEDPGWVATAVDETARLIDALEVKGVHVDFENLLLERPPDLTYPDHVNRFFRELRRRLPGAFISAVIPSTAPGVRSWKQPHSVTQVDELVGLVDQLIVLFYDTSIQDPGAFEAELAIQIDHFARWKARAPHTQLLVAVGTFVNGPALRRFRDLEVESIEHHFVALVRAMAPHPAQVVDGSAVYCEWQTDASEWARLRPFLTDPKPSRDTSAAASVSGDGRLARPTGYHLIVRTAD